MDTKQLKNTLLIFIFTFLLTALFYPRPLCFGSHSGNPPQCLFANTLFSFYYPDNPDATDFGLFSINLPQINSINLIGYIMILIGVLNILYLENKTPSTKKTQYYLTAASTIAIGIVGMITTTIRTTTGDEIYQFNPELFFSGDITYQFNPEQFFSSLLYNLHYDTSIIIPLTLSIIIAFIHFKLKDISEQFTIKTEEELKKIISFLLIPLIWILYIIYNHNSIYISIVFLITLFTTVTFIYLKCKIISEQDVKKYDTMKTIIIFLLIWILFMVLSSILYYCFVYYISRQAA